MVTGYMRKELFQIMKLIIQHMHHLLPLDPTIVLSENQVSDAVKNAEEMLASCWL